MRKIISVIAISTVLISCKKEDVATFTEPQPTATKNLTEFPKKYIGTFYNSSNENEIVISKDLMLTRYVLHDTLTSMDFEKLNNNEKTEYTKFSENQFVLQDEFTDTLFSFKKGDVLRKFKGSLILNHYKTENSWSVSKMQLRKGALEINKLGLGEDLEKLSAMTQQIPTDTLTPIVVTLSKDQFKKFIKDNGFTEETIYLKKK